MPDLLVDADSAALIRRILKSDNKRIEREIEHAKAEMILGIGFEGGCIEITRFTTAEGKIYFRNSGNSIDLDEHDDEVWRSWLDDPTISFEDALDELNFGWRMLYTRVSSVHPSVKGLLRNHIQTLLPESTEDDEERLSSVDLDAWFARL